MTGEVCPITVPRAFGEGITLHSAIALVQTTHCDHYERRLHPRAPGRI